MDPFFVPDSVAGSGYKVYYAADSRLRPFRNYQLTIVPIVTKQRIETIPTNQNVTVNKQVSQLCTRTLTITYIVRVSISFVLPGSQSSGA